MRSDIQFLRGIAVLAVVLYHLSPATLGSGFLGVDVFFVISGFLITNVILRGIESNRFSFAEFYTRRAKRLLPAAYSTFILCTLLAYQFLTQAQWDDYIEQLFGSITFTANIVLPLQSGYFEEASETKPLLHIWSLSLEEQYYLIMPLLIFLTPKAWRGWLFLFGIIASLVLCIYFVSFSFYYWRFPTANYSELAFYSLPTRAWELLAGSLLAWLMLRHPNLGIPVHLKRIALVVLFVGISYRMDEIHPRGDALIIVIATSLMIAGKDNWLPKNLLTRAVKKVGDWSYSLYLLHWPLIVFATAGYLGSIPTSAKIFIFFFSLAIAFLQYKFIEEPFRHSFLTTRRTSLRWLSAATALVVACTTPAIAHKYTDSETDSPDFRTLRRANTGLNNLCEAEEGGFFKYPAICSTSDSPAVAIWGDSFAMHLVPGLLTDPDIGKSFVQLTMGSCPPIMQTARLTERESPSWPQQCIQHNKLSLNYLLNSENVKVVIISADFSGFISKSGLKVVHGDLPTSNNHNLSKKQLIKTITQIRSTGKQVIIVGPIPSTGLNIGECSERIDSGLIVFGRGDCELPYAAVKERQKATLNAIDEIARESVSETLWIDQSLCQKETCQTKIDNTYLYLDATHLTITGSEYLIPKTGLPELVKTMMNNTSLAAQQPLK